MRKERVLIIVPEHNLMPENAKQASDEEFEQFKAVHDVLLAAQELGHDWEQLGLWDDLVPLRDTVASYKPSIVFNLLDQFRDHTVYDQHIVSYLQLLRVPFTGCNPRGLVLASDKALSKKIVLYHRVRAPRFQFFPRRRRPRLSKRLRFPLIVKVHLEEASTGISQASVVHDEAALFKRVEFVHEHFEKGAVVEEYVEGREIYVSVVGNERLRVLPPWELYFGELPPDVPHIATQRVKWNLKYQEKHKIRIGPAAEVSEELGRELDRTTRRIYKALNLSGYARIDYRLREDGTLFFLEANANPDISLDEELASAARQDGLEYPQLIHKVLSLGRRWAESF